LNIIWTLLKKTEQSQFITSKNPSCILS
jgi:hypothetical protein